MFLTSDMNVGFSDADSFSHKSPNLHGVAPKTCMNDDLCIQLPNLQRSPVLNNISYHIFPLS